MITDVRVQADRQPPSRLAPTNTFRKTTMQNLSFLLEEQMAHHKYPRTVAFVDEPQTTAPGKIRARARVMFSDSAQARRVGVRSCGS
ncbi:hypothetical protein [Rhodococcus sp. LB1]|uniref:hypothetical protein n=1 Tax=Rhodococcus sp. LB1 TaxID=1807499 RepID=UPI00077B06F9|nr:hypothetical protein [Rhodococcus sp. LB1]KXX58990.1 hypothetical protein AZG88_43210 [Rhodococcus sp. LB1]